MDGRTMRNFYGDDARATRRRSPCERRNFGGNESYDVEKKYVKKKKGRNSLRPYVYINTLL